MGATVRVAALADLHCTKTSQGAFQPLFARIAESADILVMAGDLTDYGLPEEAAVLVKELSALRIPAAAVLGNHDWESGKSTEVRQLLNDAGVHVLDGDACEVQGVGIAGVKGFGGGFGRHALAPWGESIIKQFVREAAVESSRRNRPFVLVDPCNLESGRQAQCFGVVAQDTLGSPLHTALQVLGRSLCSLHCLGGLPAKIMPQHL